MKVAIWILLTGALLTSNAFAQSAPLLGAKALGTLQNSFNVQGQFYGAERQHSYRFTLPQAGCILIGNLAVSKTLKVTLSDNAGGAVQNTLMQPLSRTKSPGGMKLKLLPADYVLQIEHFRRSDTSGIYEIMIRREGC